MKPAKRITAKSALAASLGTTTSELDDYRYQPTRTSRPVYSVGKLWYCAGNEAPDDWLVPGVRWTELTDKHFAQQANTKLWIGR